MALSRYEFAFETHPGAREEQQDAAGFTDPADPATADRGLLGIVCDGMGGLSYGAAASQIAVTAFRDAYTAKRSDETIPQALSRSIDIAHKEVLTLSSRGTSPSGSTLVAAVLKGLDLYWIGAGDSRAWLLRGATVTVLTADHNVGNDRVLRPGGIYPEQAGPQDLTSYMGSPKPLQFELSWRALRLRPRDTVVLGSDGLYNAIEEQELSRLVGKDLKQGCRDLMQLVLEQRIEGQDNVSILAMRQTDGNPAA